MPEQDPQSSHTFITAIGVMIFVALIVGFWWKGLPNLFKNSETVPPVVHSLQDQWEQINASAAQTQNLIDKQQATSSTDDIALRLKEILSTTANATNTSTTTP